MPTGHVLTLDLRDDPEVIAAYRQYHAEIWPEVERSLRDAGIRRLEIHLLGTRLVMIVEVQDGLDFARVLEAHAASHPRVAEWERLMKTFQQPAPGARPGEWWALMEPVYQLSGHQTRCAAAGDPVRTP
ncbi:MAG: L-rhamnose mutarotase [Vicinamibacterales bacterium]